MAPALSPTACPYRIRGPYPVPTPHWTLWPPQILCLPLPSPCPPGALSPTLLPPCSLLLARPHSLQCVGPSLIYSIISFFNVRTGSAPRGAELPRAPPPAAAPQRLTRRHAHLEARPLTPPADSSHVSRRARPSPPPPDCRAHRNPQAAECASRLPAAAQPTTPRPQTVGSPEDGEVSVLVWPRAVGLELGRNGRGLHGSLLEPALPRGAGDAGAGRADLGSSGCEVESGRKEGHGWDREQRVLRPQGRGLTPPDLGLEGLQEPQGPLPGVERERPEASGRLSGGDTREGVRVGQGQCV